MEEIFQAHAKEIAEHGDRIEAFRKAVYMLGEKLGEDVELVNTAMRKQLVEEEEQPY